MISHFPFWLIIFARNVHVRGRIIIYHQIWTVVHCLVLFQFIVGIKLLTFVTVIYRYLSDTFRTSHLFRFYGLTHRVLMTLLFILIIFTNFLKGIHHQRTRFSDTRLWKVPILAIFQDCLQIGILLNQHDVGIGKSAPLFFQFLQTPADPF